MAEASCLILPCYSPKGFHAVTGSFTVCLPISYEPGLPGLVLSPFVVVSLSAFEILADSGEGRAGQGNEIRRKARCVEHQIHAISDSGTDTYLQYPPADPSEPKCENGTEHKQADHTDKCSNPA